jgi:hypothetical protein
MQAQEDLHLFSELLIDEIARGILFATADSQILYCPERRSYKLIVLEEKL